MSELSSGARLSGHAVSPSAARSARAEARTRNPARGGRRGPLGPAPRRCERRRGPLGSGPRRCEPVVLGSESTVYFGSITPRYGAHRPVDCVFREIRLRDVDRGRPASTSAGARDEPGYRRPAIRARFGCSRSARSDRTPWLRRSSSRSRGRCPFPPFRAADRSPPRSAC